MPEIYLFVDFLRWKLLLNKNNLRKFNQNSQSISAINIRFLRIFPKKVCQIFTLFRFSEKKRPLIQIYGLWKRRWKARSLIWLAMWTNVELTSLILFSGIIRAANVRGKRGKNCVTAIKNREEKEKTWKGKQNVKHDKWLFFIRKLYLFCWNWSLWRLQRGLFH